MLDGLAFLPVVDVLEGMRYLQLNIPEYDGLEDLLTYFDETYVNGAIRTRNARQNGRIVLRLFRSPPPYPPPLWNCFESTVNGGSRTNNVCEGWNHSFAALVGHVHPSLWTLISAMQQDQALVSAAILQDARGQPPTKRQKRATVQLQQRLLRLCQDRRDGRKSVIETLRAVSHTIRFD